MDHGEGRIQLWDSLSRYEQEVLGSHRRGDTVHGLMCGSILALCNTSPQHLLRLLSDLWDELSGPDRCEPF